MTSSTSTSAFRAGGSAIITGAALGIGRAAAKELASRGMNVCLIDVLEEDLAKVGAAVSESHPKGSDGVYATSFSVSDLDAFERFRDEATERFGDVHVLMNNAVTRDSRGFDAGVDAWRNAFDVNFWGVVNGVSTLMPAMQQHGAAAAIINVGSKQGITNPPGHPIYNVAKSAVKTYTEALQHELRNIDGNTVSAHLLVPGWTTSGNNEHKDGAWHPEQVVERMIAEVERGDFYIICPDGEVTEEMDRKRILWGAGDITENRPALSRWHPEFADAAKDVCG